MGFACYNAACNKNWRSRYLKNLFGVSLSSVFVSVSFPVMQYIKKVVIGGGAVKAIAFLGVLECLQRRQSFDLQNVEVFVGASAGALLSALLNIGYTAAELYHAVATTEFSELAEPDIGKLFSRFGLDSGHRVIAKLREMFAVKGFEPDVTLQQLHALTGKRLVITVTQLGSGVRYLDYRCEPNLAVISAVRMSIGIPGYFTPVKYGNDYYVDGGMLDNVPLAVFGDGDTRDVLVIRRAHQDRSGGEVDADSLEHYLWLLWTTNASEMERLRHRSDGCVATVFVETSDCNTIAVTQQDKKSLLRDGYVSALRFLDSLQFIRFLMARLPQELQQHILSYVSG